MTPAGHQSPFSYTDGVIGIITILHPPRLYIEERLDEAVIQQADTVDLVVNVGFDLKECPVEALEHIVEDLARILAEKKGAS